VHMYKVVLGPFPTRSRPLLVLESRQEALPLADLRRLGFWHGRWLWDFLGRRRHGRGIIASVDG
jgi:hypothetical protein